MTKNWKTLKKKKENLVPYSDDVDGSSSIVDKIFKDEMNYYIYEATMNVKKDDLCIM